MYKTTGFIAWAMRRFTGVVLALYLFVHIWVIGSATQGAEVFNQRLATVQTPFTHIMEILLLAAVIYHGFDGIRLLIINWFKVTDQRKSMFYAAFAISAILTIVGGIPMLLYALEHM